MSNVEIKIIDGNEQEKLAAGLQGQNQDTGPKQKHHHMMHHMMKNQSSVSDSSFGSSLSSESLSSTSLSSGESFSESSVSGAVSSFSSGSQSSSLSSGSEGSFSSSVDNAGGKHHRPENPPMMDDGGFVVPKNFMKHKKGNLRRHMMMMMMMHSSGSESLSSFSASDSSSGSLDSLSSESISVDASSNFDSQRNQDTGPRMMKKKRLKNNLQAIPEVAEELNHYISQVNMQVPDIHGQAPVDSTPEAVLSGLTQEAETIGRMMMRKKHRKMMMKKANMKMANMKMKKKKNSMGGMKKKKNSMGGMKKKMNSMGGMNPMKKMNSMGGMNPMMKMMMPAMMGGPGKMPKSMMKKGGPGPGMMAKPGQMSGPGPGKMSGPGPGGPGKKKKMSRSSMHSMMPKSKSNPHQWSLITYTNDGGCECVPSGFAPGIGTGGATNILNIQQFRNETECRASQITQRCQTRCQRINNTLKKLRNFIDLQDQFENTNQSLIDAKELLMVIQTRYLTVCTNEQIILGPLTPPIVTFDQPYEGSIQISGGTPPYVGLRVSGLPQGLRAVINAGRIIISGTPVRTLVGDTRQTIVLEDHITVSIQDRMGDHGQKGYTLEESTAPSSSQSSSRSSSKQSSSQQQSSSAAISSSAQASSSATASPSSINSLSGEAGLFSSQAGSLIGGMAGRAVAHKQFKAITKQTKKNDMLAKSLSWWWPTPMEVVDKMFKIAKLKQGEVVYDLGCGDGRIPVQAAAKWGCTGVGVDFDENLVKQAKKRALKFNVQNKVEIRHGDALKVNDLKRADVVCLYILDRGMKLMKSMLQARLKKGTRIVSHNYQFQGWKPIAQKTVQDKEGHKHWIYLYKV